MQVHSLTRTETWLSRPFEGVDRKFEAMLRERQACRLSGEMNKGQASRHRRPRYPDSSETGERGTISWQWTPSIRSRTLNKLATNRQSEASPMIRRHPHVKIQKDYRSWGRSELRLSTSG